jgi:diguanylate cyclase (GGDEF)-like protein/PAS domain S-box-containing protein
MKDSSTADPSSRSARADGRRRWVTGTSAWRWFTRRFDANAVIALFALALIGTVWGAVIVTVQFERQETIDNAIRQNSNLAMAFEEQTIRTIKGVDAAALFIAREYARLGTKIDLAQYAADGYIDDKLFDNVYVINERGDLVLSSHSFKPTNLADREHFMVHVQRETGKLFIGKPLLGRASGKWTIHMTRRINRPDGSFGGIVSMAVDPGYFTSFYQQTDLGKLGLVNLVGVDGISRARLSGKVAGFGQDMSKSNLLREQAKGGIGTFLSTGRTEGVARYESFRTIPGYPLVIAVGTSQDELLATFARRSEEYYWAALLVTGVIVLFSVLLMKTMGRQTRAVIQFRTTFEQAAVGIAHISFDGQHLMANRKYCEMLGYAQDELLALSADTVTARDGPGALPTPRADLFEGGIDHYSGERKFFCKDGSPIWVNRTISLARDARGEPLYYIRVIEDLSERKAVEAARQQSDAEFGALFNQAAVGMAETDMRGVFLRVNEKLCSMLGYTADELLGLRFQQITHSDDLTRNLELLRSFASGERQAYTYEKRYVCKDGSALWVSVTMSRVSTGPDSAPNAFAVIEDISERKRAEERLMYLAQFDALTGLPNRSLVRDRLTLAIARAKRNDQMVGVMFLDLDNFSEVNDLLGHAAGDRVLQTAAALLSASLRDVDTLGRLGGDEFTIVLENITGEDQVSTVAEKIKKVFAEPIVVDGREIFVSASVGIAFYPHGGETVDALLQSADVAMYHAKGQGRNVHAFASPTMTAEASERFQMVALLRRAMERQEFKLHYQPIVDLKSRDIIGAEALIRLDSPEHGLISPAKFIPLAEGTGLIVPIGEWVLKTACLEAKNWQVQGQPPVLVSVNLSARQLRTKGLVEMIAGTLSETGLAPELLKLEITESQIMEDGRDVMDRLDAIRRLGVGLAMDDFGTGYSSLGNLAKLPVQVLKIDRSFVARMLDDSDAMALVSTILTLARSLRLKVVAEGVETEQQEKALRLLRCDEMQGYFFSRPLPAAEFAALLARHRRAVDGGAGASRAALETASVG